MSRPFWKACTYVQHDDQRKETADTEKSPEHRGSLSSWPIKFPAHHQKGTDADDTKTDASDDQVPYLVRLVRCTVHLWLRPTGEKSQQGNCCDESRDTQYGARQGGRLSDIALATDRVREPHKTAASKDKQGQETEPSNCEHRVRSGRTLFFRLGCPIHQHDKCCGQYQHREARRTSDTSTNLHGRVFSHIPFHLITHHSGNPHDSGSQQEHKDNKHGFHADPLLLLQRTGQAKRYQHEKEKSNGSDTSSHCRSL
mmetsp:Transcript_3931/g.10916  ORF Transcript_3931/g.10916 Transcript_3931/m.10916 type:complete len:255 (+) Transcript_3931:390-1154(+)